MAGSENFCTISCSVTLVSWTQCHAMPPYQSISSCAYHQLPVQEVADIQPPSPLLDREFLRLAWLQQQ
eukprot:1562408-Amphidinium_carterae.1